MRLLCVSEPTVEPISRTAAKLHLRVDTDITADDTLIDGLISAARRYVERVTNRQIVCAQYRLDLDDFPADDFIMLPRAPLVAVSSVKYYDTAGVLQTLATTEYSVDAISEPGTVYLAYQKTWPSCQTIPHAVQITYVAGYAAPFTIAADTDVATLATRVPVNADPVRLSNTGGALPAGLSAYTTYYIIGSSGQTCQLSATVGGTPVNATGAGTGTHFVGVIPEELTQAMLLILGDFYEHRTHQTDRELSKNIATEALLAPYRITDDRIWNQDA